MVLKKKIEKTREHREDIISRGGHVAADIKPKKKKMKYLLTMPMEMNQEIVNQIQKRIGVTKNTWILESIIEKLEKEQWNQTMKLTNQP